MPTPAHPVARVQFPDTVQLRRVYVDHLQRPLTGIVQVMAKERAASGDTVIPAGPTTPVELANGVLDIQVPPGRYRLRAQLRAVDGSLVNDDHEVTLGSPNRKAD